MRRNVSLILYKYFLDNDQITKDQIINLVLENNPSMLENADKTEEAINLINSIIIYLVESEGVLIVLDDELKSSSKIVLNSNYI